MFDIFVFILKMFEKFENLPELSKQNSTTHKNTIQPTLFGLSAHKQGFLPCLTHNDIDCKHV